MVAPFFIFVIMNKTLVTFLLAITCIGCFAQKPLSYSIVIDKKGADAQTLYDLTRNWFAQTYHNSEAVLQDQNSGKELTGRGTAILEISKLTYSGMSGYIDYLIDVQFKDGRLKFSMNSFNHRPEKKVMYDNAMGAVLDSLPEDLKTLGGRFEKSSYRMYYRHFYEYAKPVCDNTFIKLSQSLKEFIEKREATKDDW